MSEGYSQFSAVGMVDVLEKVVAFAELHGWSLHQVSDPRQGTSRTLHKDGIYINFWARDYVTDMRWAFQPAHLPYTFNADYFDLLLMNCSTGFSTSAMWYRQEGYRSSRETGFADSAAAWKVVAAGGAINAHLVLLENPATLLLVVEPAPGICYWLVAGASVNKAYDWAGGQFSGGSFEAQSTRLERHLGNTEVVVHHSDVARTSANDQWSASWASPAGVAAGPASGSAYTVAPNNIGARVPAQWPRGDIQAGAGTASDVVLGAWDPLTGRLWTHPVRLYARRPGPSMSYLGELPHLLYTTVEAFNPGDTISLAGTDYLVFPGCKRVSPFKWNVGLIQDLQYPKLAEHGFYGTGFAIRKPA